MFTSFTGYADDNFLSKIWRKKSDFGGYSKISWTLQGKWGSLFFNLRGPLTLGGTRATPVSRGVVVRGRGLVEP